MSGQFALVQSVRRFRAEREPAWVRLEGLLDRAQKRGIRALDADELAELPVLYRATLSSLSVARDTSLDRALTDYLEALSARAYFFVYGTRARLGAEVRRFFAVEWPGAARALWRETVVAGLLLLGGAVIGWLLAAGDPSWFSAFVPPEIAAGRDPTASAEALRKSLYDPPDGTGGLSAFAAFLFTNNAGVAILCFALGFLLGVPTILLLIKTGAMLGAILWLFAGKGLGPGIVGWLMIHGSTELFAIVLAGGAGLSIGRALALPGELSRTEALKRSGRRAGVLMGGVVLMLFVAGLLEGFARQLITDDLARYAIAAGMLLFWLGYLYAPRRGRA